MLMLKKFLINTIKYLFFIYVFFLFLEVIIYKKISKPNNRYYVQFDWFDNVQHNSQILALGNSRTWVQLNPLIVADSTQKSCEIIACDGQDATLVYYKFKNYLINNSLPEILVIQYDANFYGMGGEMYGSKNWSAGYFMNRIQFGNAKTYSGYKYYYQFMPLFGIDTKTRIKILKNHIVGNDSLFEMRRGYFPNYDFFNGKWLTDKRINMDAKINPHYDSILNFAVKNKIKVILLTPPYSKVTTDNSKEYSKQLKVNYRQLCNKYSLEFKWIDHHENKLYSDSSNFYNHLHLNSKGSFLYSKIVASKLKSIFNINN